MDDRHELCLASIEGTVLLCTKGAVHNGHPDSRRQMHYDETLKVAWGEDATAESFFMESSV